MVEMGMYDEVLLSNVIKRYVIWWGFVNGFVWVCVRFVCVVCLWFRIFVGC